MRIGIDGRELVSQPTGVGRYLTALCAEWLDHPDHGHHLVIYTPASPDGPPRLAAPLADRPLSRLTHRAIGRHHGTRWEQGQLASVANRDSLDVFFAPAYSAPLLLRIPSVVTMHDVSFAAHPEWFPWREGLRRRWLAGRSMARAAAILTVSEFSKREIVRLYDVASDRIEVIYHGLTSPAAPPAPGPREPLILYAGSVFNRRHLPTLIRAFAQVRRAVPDAELRIVGANRTYPAQDIRSLAGQHAVADRVTLHSYVPDDQLAALYRRASVYAFLSEYEGFGLPPLEALTAGVPIVVGDTPVAREIYGAAAWFVDPLDATATARAILALLDDPDMDSASSPRRRLLAHAPAQLARFSWTRAATETMAELEAAAHGATATG